jgi:hypothetical protein
VLTLALVHAFSFHGDPDTGTADYGFKQMFGRRAYWTAVAIPSTSTSAARRLPSSAGRTGKLPPRRYGDGWRRLPARRRTVMQNLGGGRWPVFPAHPYLPRACPRTIPSAANRLPGYEIGVSTLPRLTEMRGIS